MLRNVNIAKNMPQKHGRSTRKVFKRARIAECDAYRRKKRKQIKELLQKSVMEKDGPTSARKRKYRNHKIRVEGSFATLAIQRRSKGRRRRRFGMMVSIGLEQKEKP